MSHPLINLPNAPRPGLSVAQGNGPAAAPGRAAPADDGFARALEQRMNAPERAASRQEEASAPAPASPGTQRSERAERVEPADGKATAREESEGRPEPSTTAAPAPEGAKPLDTPRTHPADSAGRPDAHAQAQTPVATAAMRALEPETTTPEAPDPTLDPTEQAAAAVAAILAGSAPFTAAAAAPLAATEAIAAEESLPGEGQRRPLSLALERLLKDIAQHKTQSGGSVADYDSAATARQAKSAELRAPSLAIPTQPASAQPAGAQPAVTAVEALAARAPDGQAPLVSAPALQPAARSEQPALPQLPVSTPAGQRGWAEEVGNRVSWMLGRNDVKAELVLTPANLGKIEISIQMAGDQTTAQFVAASAAARDALEQALPRLREILQQAGINLGQANVSTSGEQQTGQDGAAGHGRPGHRLGAAADPAEGMYAPVPATGWVRTGTGMVDTFA